MLGGSRQQVVAIEKAKELGYRTVLCDYLPDNPGQYVADVFYQESTTDWEKILEIARKEGVSGVLAYSSDPAAPTAGYVAETLGLPTNPLSAIEAMSEKHLFRAFLAERGLPCPKATGFPASIDPARLWERVKGFRMPVVVKPTDSSGSKGVSVLSAEAELPAAIAHAAGFSRNGTLICEEYIRRSFPHVIGGDVFVVDGEIRFWGLMSCLRDEALGGLVPVGEYLPSGLAPAQRANVKAVLQRLVTALGLRFGELNVEVIVGENDVPYVLELGARGRKHDPRAAFRRQRCRPGGSERASRHGRRPGRCDMGFRRRRGRVGYLRAACVRAGRFPGDRAFRRGRPAHLPRGHVRGARQCR